MYDAAWIAALSILAAGEYDGELVRNVAPIIAERYIGASGHKMLDENDDAAIGDYEIMQSQAVDGQLRIDFFGHEKPAVETLTSLNTRRQMPSRGVLGRRRHGEHAAPHAVAVAFEHKDVGVVQKAVQDGRRGARVAEQLAPLTKIQVCRDDERSSFVRLGDELKLGSSNWRIIFVHVLPNAVSPVISSFVMSIPGAIMTISSLGFIGLGVQPPDPEWGVMLASGRAFIRDSWHITAFPGAAIVVTIIGLTLVGDGLRDALDPRMKN